MGGMGEGIRKLCVAYDVERYSGRGTRSEFATQQRLSDLLGFAFREAGLDSGGYEIQEQGDGGLALLPTGGQVDEPRRLVTLIRALITRATEVNEELTEHARMRLRVALAEGVVHRAAHGYVGPVIIEACRLRDAEPVKSGLADSAGLLAIAAADGLYQDVLAHGYHGLPGSAFEPVDFTLNGRPRGGWLYLPADANSVPVSPARQQQAPGSRPDEAPGSIDGFLTTDPRSW